jgi:succinoglycan biosynthesis transport protein ExoP
VELDDVLQALRSRKRWVAGGLLAGLLLAVLLSWSAERTYTSTSQLFVSVTGSPDQTAPLDADTFAQQRMSSYVRVLTGVPMAERVSDDLGLSVPADELARQVSVTALPGTVVLQVTVTAATPEQAQEIGESVLRQFTAWVEELETPRGRTTPAVEIDALQTPTFAPEPVSPGWRRNLLLGAATGLLLGVGMALLRSRLDTSVRGEDDVRHAAGAELLGRVPEDVQQTDLGRSRDLDREPASADAYRTVRVNLWRTGEDRSPRVVVVAGALPGEGASTVAVHLAVSLARSGRRVLLVDCDFRRPRVSRYLDLPEDAPGLSEVLAGTIDLHLATRPWADQRLTVLGAGTLLPDLDSLLTSARWADLLGTLRSEYDQVVIDAPPLVPVIDAAAVSALADGCVLVTRFGSTTRAELTEAAVVLERAHARLLGVVLNRVPDSRDAPGRAGTYPVDPDRVAQGRVHSNGHRRLGQPDHLPPGRHEVGGAG